MLPRVGDRRRGRAKFPESKYLELRPEPPELDHFPGFGAGVGTFGTLNCEPESEASLEPEPFKTIQGSTSQLLAMRCHP